MTLGHINNLYNTTFWTMIQRGGMSNTDAERELKVSQKHIQFGAKLTEKKGTVSSDKNEILFLRYGINYNNEPEMYKKGSVLFREVSRQRTSPSLMGLVTDSI